MSSEQLYSNSSYLVKDDSKLVFSSLSNKNHVFNNDVLVKKMSFNFKKNYLYKNIDNNHFFWEKIK